MNKQNIIRLLQKRAHNNVEINHRLYVSYHDDAIINTRYWLAFGILNSGVKDEVAQEYSRTVAMMLGNKDYFEKSHELIFTILNSTTTLGRYRFPQIRSQWLHASLQELQLHDNKLPIEKIWSTKYQRDQLVKHFKGIGLKQASLLLRNLGFNYDCCVVDTHIVDFLIFIGWIPSGIKTTGINRKKYFAIESLFKRLSNILSTPVSLLDIATWDLTRAMKANNLI